MDLHIVGAEPTPDERAAVDAVLGPAQSGWAGGTRGAGLDEARTARGGWSAARSRRDLLLPALHGVQDRIGWISRGALNDICRRLLVPPAEAWGVVTFYHLFRTEPQPPTAVHVCDDIACRLRGAEAICQDLAADPKATRGRGDGMRSPCLGQCDRAPAALVVRAGAHAVGRRDHRHRQRHCPDTGDRRATRARRHGVDRRRYQATAPRRQGRSVEPVRLPRLRRLSRPAAGARPRA